MTNILAYLTLATAVLTTSMALTVDEVSALVSQSQQQIALISKLNQDGILEASAISYGLQTPNASPVSVQTLVDVGYLKQSYITTGELP